MIKLAGAAFLMLLAACASTRVYQTECQATLNTFNSLYAGMSLEQAVRKIGCEGVVISQVDTAGRTTVMIGWDGTGSIGANMNSMFQQGVLISKSQFGLR